MLTGKQIRAARVLLDWDTETFAERTGYRRETIIAIEKGYAQPRTSTMAKITQTLIDAGIEFLDNSGVRFKIENFGVLENMNGFQKFSDMVIEHASTYGGNICVSGVDEKLFEKYLVSSDNHLARMTNIAKQRKDFSMRILVKEGDYHFPAETYASYRWMPKEYFSSVPFYVFGDTLALISFESNPAPLVFLVRSGHFAEAYRQSFNFVWNHSKDPPDKKTKKKKDKRIKKEKAAK